MGSDSTQPIDKINRYLQKGRSDLARKELKELTKTKVSRELALGIAVLARRAGLFALALRLLNPYVRPSAKKPVVATDEEKAEYAASLAFLGLSEEALGIIKTIDIKNVPEALLYEAFARVSVWDYANTIALLKRYVLVPKLSPYQRLVGRINLAAALVHERQSDEASSVLQALVLETRKEALDRLYGNALELSAQNAINKREWGEAGNHLKASERLLSETAPLELFFVKKWKAVIRLLKSRGERAAVKGLGAIRDEARRLQHWETIRDCDRYEMLCLNDERRFLHLYFGTPFEAFRRSLLHEYGNKIEIPATYTRYLNRNTEPTLDLITGQVSRGKMALKPGQALFRLMVALAGDFYRPIRVTNLHSLVYPEEYFNPVSSPDRVHQILKRLRRWIKRSRFPVEIVEYDGFFSLGSKKGCRLVTTVGKRPAPDLLAMVEQLRKRCGEKLFTVQQARAYLHSSPSALHRLLRRGVEEKMVIREGKSSATKYRIIQQDKNTT